MAISFQGLTVHQLFLEFQVKISITLLSNREVQAVEEVVEILLRFDTASTTRRRSHPRQIKNVHWLLFNRSLAGDPSFPLSGSYRNLASFMKAAHHIDASIQLIVISDPEIFNYYHFLLYRDEIEEYIKSP